MMDGKNTHSINHINLGINLVDKNNKNFTSKNNGGNILNINNQNSLNINTNNNDNKAMNLINGNNNNNKSPLRKNIGDDAENHNLNIKLEELIKHLKFFEILLEMELVKFFYYKN